ncbi:hypothetical protein ACFSQ7_41265 [Paenibacillus rhizoplanae]
MRPLIISTKIEFPEASPTVSDLYQWKESKRNILFGGLACLIFQGETDNFARTLEEAMLAKHYKNNYTSTASDLN